MRKSRKARSLMRNETGVIISKAFMDVRVVETGGIFPRIYVFEKRGDKQDLTL